MRRAVVLLLVLGACGSKKPPPPGAAADALWQLAPDQTSLAVVITPTGVATIARALPSLRTLFDTPDLAELKPRLDAVLTAALGKADADAAASGIAVDRGLATFVTADGHSIAILPVANRDTWLALRGGTRGGSGQDDHYGSRICREVRGLYACADDAAMFDRLGKGSLRGKVAALGDRGEIEMFGADVVPFDAAKGELVAIARLADGAIEVRGRWTGTPDGLAGRLVGTKAPVVDPSGASGFARIDLAPLLGDASEVPLAAGVTALDFAKSLKGPVSVTVPAGTVDLQMHAPLADAKPATTLVEHCDDLPLPHVASTAPGACRLAVQLASPLELDTWVEHDELRVAAHKGAPSAGKPGALTAIGKELAAGEWSAAFWGRGTLLDGSHVTPTTEDLPLPAARAIHLMALVDELGAAIAFEKDGFRFRLYARTVYGETPDTAAKLAAVGGNDIARGRSTAIAKTIATAAPASPFAADLDAGQGGLAIPAAVGGVLAGLAVQRITAWLEPDAVPQESDDEMPPPGQPPMDQAALTRLLLQIYVQQAIPSWREAHPKDACPAKVDDLSKYLQGAGSDVPLTSDPWGHPLVMHCDAKTKAIDLLSVGPDGKEGTPDDVHP